MQGSTCTVLYRNSVGFAEGRCAQEWQSWAPLWVGANITSPVSGLFLLNVLKKLTLGNSEKAVMCCCALTAWARVEWPLRELKSSVGVWEKSADHLVSVAVWGIWQAGLGSHFSRCESRSALGTQLSWLNWPLPWTWPWALADFALNLTVRQRKECFTLCVLKSLCTEVWSHIIFNWITPSSQRRGRRAIPSLRTAYHNRRHATAHQVLCPCTQSPDQGHPVWGKRRVEAHLCYSRKQGVNLSEKLDNLRGIFCGVQGCTV